MVPNELLDQARKLQRPALDELLGALAAGAMRVAAALCGRSDVAQRIMRRVIARALVVIPKWRDADEATRWFGRYTVMVCRGAAHEPTDERLDPLLEADSPPTYRAFIRAVRGLESQPREALILNHCEHLNERYLAVAMDCSTEAAGHHLLAAESRLRAMAGEQYGAMLAAMVQAYGRMSAEIGAAPRISRMIARALWPRRLALAFKLLLAAGIAIAIWWFLYK